jgi:hypothetical protein
LVKKTTEVHTDDPATPVQKLRIKANVTKWGESAGVYSLKPPRLTWRANKGTLLAELDTLLIINNGADSADVTVLHLTQAGIKGLKAPPCIAPGETASLVLQAVKRPALGNGEKLSATLLLTNPDTTIVTIPIAIKE